MESLPSDLYYIISIFSGTTSIVNLLSCNKKMYSVLPYISIHLKVKIRSTQNLDFIYRLPYEIRKLDISYNKNISDEDFKYLKDIKELQMSSCNNFTDKAFQYLTSIKKLIMSFCSRNTITDNAFQYLTGIEELDMSYCNQKTLQIMHSNI